MRIDNQTVATLQQFYALMAKTREVRLVMVERLLANSPVDTADVESLEAAARALKAIPITDDGAVVSLDENRTITIDVSYEINELVKDIFYLTNGEQAFEQHLRDLHPTLD